MPNIPKTVIVELLEVLDRLDYYMMKDQTEYSIEECMKRGDVIDKMIELEKKLERSIGR